MKLSKEILLNELEEQMHPEPVEDVIFWALEAYAKKKPNTWGRAIAYSIVKRIEEAEHNKSVNEN